MEQRILVIEDEPTLSKLLSYNLEQEGYETVVTDNGLSGLNIASSEQFDLILLDIMLPGLNGFEVLSKLRQSENKTPVIILTARTAEGEIVQGLKLGADDYITKPFGVAELLARVSAVLRRSITEDWDQPQLKEKKIEIGEVQIFPERYEVNVKGKVTPLRPKEFEVLLYLVERPGSVITRDELMNNVWGFDYVGGQRTVDVHVSSLRKKLELNQESMRIDAIRGVGYKLIILK